MISSDKSSDVIRLGFLFEALWQRKLIILISVAIFGGLGALYAANEADIYRAEVVTVIPSSQTGSSLGNIGGALGGLVGMNGLSSGDSPRMKLEQVEKLLTSRSFVHNLIEKYEMKPDLLAALSWSNTDDKIIYDQELYDGNQQEWVISEPSAWRVYGEFRKRVRIETLVSKNMLIVNVDHHSPEKAKLWAENIIAELNHFYKTRAEEEAAQSIEYLQNLMSSTDFIFVREAISGLIEEQIKTDMLVKARQEYAFETLAPAVVPEGKVHPKRLIITVIGMILGGLIGAVIALLLGVKKKLRQQ